MSDVELLRSLERELERSEREEVELRTRTAHPAEVLLKRVHVRELRRKVATAALAVQRHP